MLYRNRKLKDCEAETLLSLEIVVCYNAKIIVQISYKQAYSLLSSHYLLPHIYSS